ncbi:DNA-binding response OmpR family regulator [Pedobacter sp. W3I1]|uniref:response regulator n=1 Tax=Pedobacter sp. W3I1 TaxID=3042291 RepID=UPI00277F35E7|nr:response regulator [Pedobacter sp. W3I1]MDQ0639946.1 DNA-binding response OmpR family regulator [Pedobacter sp. W3I1]
MEEVIMVQDTDESILDVLKTALEMEGFKVIPMLHCDDDIIDMIDKNRPHVVLLDIRLTNKDCVDICQKIKAKYPHLPVIALSCNVNIREKYAKDGFDGYIEKPFDIDLLYKIIRSHLPHTSCNVD